MSNLSLTAPPSSHQKADEPLNPSHLDQKKEGLDHWIKISDQGQIFSAILKKTLYKEKILKGQAFERKGHEKHFQINSQNLKYLLPTIPFKQDNFFMFPSSLPENSTTS